MSLFLGGRIAEPYVWVLRSVVLDTCTNSPLGWICLFG